MTEHQDSGSRRIKSLALWLGGLCFAAIGFLVLGARRVPSVEERSDPFNEG